MMSWLGFGDHDLIFKVTAGLKLPNLSPKVLVCTISHDLVDGFQPDLHGYNIGTWWRADLILVTLTYFSRSVRGLNCQIWAKMCLCAQYLMNQLADFNQICMDITFGHDKKLKRFWWPWSNFQVTVRLLVECPLRGMGGHEFDPGLGHTKVVRKRY